MKQIPNYGDTRQQAGCFCCYRFPTTRDHVPSKVFLDEPYPSELPVVPACERCNNSFSLDEEYVACLVECTLAGSTDPASLRRAKIRRILTEKPNLRALLVQSQEVTDGKVTFRVDAPRVENVLNKLVRGHATFELNDPHHGLPLTVRWAPLICMSSEQRQAFETCPKMELRPEVGSRAMQRGVWIDGQNEWVIAQENRYRYLVAGPDCVRIVISEYLACEGIWRMAG